MIRYTCQLCGYTTDKRNKIHHHHIEPKELGGVTTDWNLVYLCPNCHANIFVRDSKSGIHSIESQNSIEINCWRNGHTTLEYHKINSNKLLYN